MQKNNKLVILTGPTAVGKTALSIELAKKLNGEIISADSIQVYKYLDIGSAKIMPEEMEGIPHHLIDFLEPTTGFNVADFKELAKKTILDIQSRGKIPIIVGGTGFYIQAVLRDIDFSKEDENDYRNELEELYKERGADYLHNMLMEVDSESANNIHKNNVKRVIRALEYYHVNKSKISDHNEEQQQKQSPYNFAYFVLNCDREKLYNNINKRVDIMLEQGLVDEVSMLVNKYGLTKDMLSMQGIGYKEMLQYLDGEMSLEEAIDLLKQNTRHFAKRQLTWFRREKEVIFIDKEIHKTTGEQLDFIINTLDTKWRK